MGQSATNISEVIAHMDRADVPWQLRMFSKTLKKKQKFAMLLGQIGETAGKRCLLVTNGDNNGALNYHFRAHGGDWTWVENEADGIPEMQQLLGDPVLKGEADRIPVPDRSFDIVVAIDVHEHLADCAPFNRELARVAKPGATVVVTTPDGTAWKPVNVLKNLVGMTKEKYGHVVIGYTIKQHREMLTRAGLLPIGSASYSKFFTECLELMLNFGFVMILQKKKKIAAKTGTVAPASGAQLRSVEKQFRLYSLLYPVMRVISKLDSLLFFTTGYAVSVVCRRPE